MILLDPGRQIFVLLDGDLQLLSGELCLITCARVFESSFEMRSSFAEILFGAGPTTGFGGGAVGEVVELISFVGGGVAKEGVGVGVGIGGRGGVGG